MDRRRYKFHGQEAGALHEAFRAFCDSSIGGGARYRLPVDCWGLAGMKLTGIKQRAVKRGLARKEENVCPRIGIDENHIGKDITM